MATAKVRIRLVDDSSAEDKTLVETVPEGMTLDKLIEKKVAGVGWADRELVVKSAQLYDGDFKQFVDITEPLDSLVLLQMQQFEVHLNKAEPKMDTILADISINGTIQQGQKLVLPSDSTVNGFILVVVSMFCKDATDTTISSVKYFDPDFEEFVDIEEPFEDVPILFQNRYAISIVYTKTSINLNSNSYDTESNVSNETSGDSSFNNSYNILFYYLYSSNNDEHEGRIRLFNSSTCSVEEIAKFHSCYEPYEVATTQNKIFGIDGENKSFEIFDFNTRQLSRGPDPPEWRGNASFAYFKDKLYYLGGEEPKTRETTNRVDILIDEKWQTGPAFPLPIKRSQTITCDGILYVIDGHNEMIYRLSDNEQGWKKVGELPEGRTYFRVAFLNEKIYITGGQKSLIFHNALKSCLCFDPSAPVDSRISRIADMNYGRFRHSLFAANGKLYAIGGIYSYNSIEEYNPQTNKWREVEEFVKPIESDIEKSRKLNELCPEVKKINPGESSKNSTRHHDIEKHLSKIEGKIPNNEPRPKRAKKDKLGTVNEMYDMYQLNSSLLTDQNDSLVSYPGFRLGNIRAAAIECGIFYNRNRNASYGINDMIRRTVVYLMAQLFKHDNTLTYTAAQKLKPGMTKFPEQVSAKIAAGMIKLIEIKSDAAKMDFETDMKIPVDQWTQLIYQEIEHALRNSPTRNTTKPLFKQISDEDHICKLSLDQQAVQSGWYENASTNYGRDAEMRNAPQQEHAQVVVYNALVPSSFSQTQVSNTTGQIIQPWISPSFAQAAVSEPVQVSNAFNRTNQAWTPQFVQRPASEPMQTSSVSHYTTQSWNSVLDFGVQQFTEQSQLPSTSAQSFKTFAPSTTMIPPPEADDIYSSILESITNFQNQSKLLKPDGQEAVTHEVAITEDALEKGNTMNELARNINNSHKILFYLYYRNNYKDEGRICLFNSSTCSVEEIVKFHNYYKPNEVTTTQNKIFALNGKYESFEIYDLNTRQTSRGPDPPEWRFGASVAYFKDKLYYLGGYTNRVDVLINGKWQTGPTLPLPISYVQTIICDEILCVISSKIYRLSDDEREWIEIGELPEQRFNFGVASLNGRIYITGGWNNPNVLKPCLCFNPSAPVDSRISRIADMNYARHDHLLVVANGKLYAIGGLQNSLIISFCNSIEEYDPQTNKWREIGKFNFE